jgi:hypothetical protein
MAFLAEAAIRNITVDWCTLTMHDHFVNVAFARFGPLFGTLSQRIEQLFNTSPIVFVTVS